MTSIVSPGCAIISTCGTFRYRLERDVQLDGIVIAYFGVNGSTATATENDQTVRKWIEFTKLNGGRRLIVGNVFGFRAKDVNALASAVDPVGPDNAAHIRSIITDADLLVPCWGSRDKLPSRLRIRLDKLIDILVLSGKPVKVFGHTRSGDPLHPLWLGYKTPLIPWAGSHSSELDLRTNLPESSNKKALDKSTRHLL